MGGMSAVAKKKAEKTVRSIAFRVTEDFGSWIEAYAKFNRTTVSALLDRCLVETAERDGFKTKPPGRV